MTLTARPISTAPKSGQFLAYSQSRKVWCHVWRRDESLGRRADEVWVTEAATGLSFAPRWWIPIPKRSTQRTP